jgi:hypothetical protein
MPITWRDEHSLDTGILHCVQNDAVKGVRLIGRLDVELEEENVAVFDDVLFAFGAEEAFFFDGLFAAESEEVAGGVAVGFDEAALEVGVDDACCAGGLGAALDGPGTDFLHA